MTFEMLPLQETKPHNRRLKTRMTKRLHQHLYNFERTSFEEKSQLWQFIDYPSPRATRIIYVMLLQSNRFAISTVS